MAFRDYIININKQVNRLVPYYLRGRKMLLFLQGICSPLNFFNDEESGLNKWAHRSLLDLSMTAQKVRLEWYINNVVVPDNGIALRSGQSVTITDDEFASAICFMRSEITDHETAPLFYPNTTPTVLRLKTNQADKAKQRIVTRKARELGGTAGRFIISVPYSGDDRDSVSRMITAGISRFVPVGVVYVIKYT
jgi:hypothetical protein